MREDREDAYSLLASTPWLKLARIIAETDFGYHHSTELACKTLDDVLSGRELRIPAHVKSTVAHILLGTERIGHREPYLPGPTLLVKQEMKKSTINFASHILSQYYSGHLRGVRWQVWCVPDRDYRRYLETTAFDFLITTSLPEVVIAESEGYRIVASDSIEKAQKALIGKRGNSFALHQRMSEKLDREEGLYHFLARTLLE